MPTVRAPEIIVDVLRAAFSPWIGTAHNNVVTAANGLRKSSSAFV